MKHKITLVPGDGIGPEVTRATLKVIEAAGIDVEWETINAGADAFQKYGKYFHADRTWVCQYQCRIAQGAKPLCQLSAYQESTWRKEPV